jgi:pSer/pThr/pTyr-binding forkhead associated (FHA) protein
VTARGAPAVAAGANGDEPHFRLLASQGEVARSSDIRGTLSIGSAPDNDIVFSGAGVASHHARIWLRDEKVMLRLDLEVGFPMVWGPNNPSGCLPRVFVM